jgi:5,10-methenyltetrahydrofolate synthetase
MSDSRTALRQSLLQARQAWAATEAAVAAQARLNEHLLALLSQLEPEGLGLYWPIRGEFNPCPVAKTLAGTLNLQRSLPHAFKGEGAEGRRMEYRVWDGQAPRAVDECGIACSDGAKASPDVLLVPCVGFTRSGFRLGYGGGYFDRYMAAHPHVTAVGVAWDEALLDDTAFAPQVHDQPLMLIVTPSGVVDA